MSTLNRVVINGTGAVPVDTVRHNMQKDGEQMCDICLPNWIDVQDSIRGGQRVGVGSAACTASVP